MLSNWRDIAVFLDASSRGETIGRDAARLAQQHNAHLIGIYGMKPLVSPPASSYARGGAIREVIEEQRRSEERQALTAGRWFSEFLQEYAIGSEFRIVWSDGPDGDSALRALHCDLIVATHPKLEHLPAGWSAEQLLRITGIPVLLIPTAWRGDRVGRHVLIAWNRSREARRAVNDAMPFIAAADDVTILIVDGDRNPDRFGESPGSNLLGHLSRHEAKVQIAHVSSEGAPVAEVIVAEAIRRGADLLIVGASSRSRPAEALFGGVTRSLLSDSRSPMFISR